MRRRSVFLLIGLCACTQTGATNDDREIAELSAQLDEANAKLFEIEDHLADIDAKLDDLARTRQAPVISPTTASPPTASPPPPAIDPTKLAAGISCTGERCTIERELLDDLLANPASLSRAARIVPAVRDGATVGYKLYGIRRESLGAALGFENGDTLTSIGGHSLASLDDAMAAYSGLKGASEVEVGLERRGEAKRMVFVIE